MNSLRTLFLVFLFVISTRHLMADSPAFVQVPTGFNSQLINTNTARYFCYRNTKMFNSITESSENYCFSLQNNGTRVVRISSLGAVVYGPGASSSGAFEISLYKSSTLTSPSYSSINASSVLQVDTTASAFSGGTNVYELPLLSASEASGSVIYGSDLKDISKELYSILIQPGETLTVTINNLGAFISNIIFVRTFVLIEEIVSYN